MPKGLYSKVRNPHLTRVKDLRDVKLTGLTDGHMLVWDSTNKEWINVQPAAGTVDYYVNSGDYNDSSQELTLNRTDGGDVIIDLSAIAAGGTDEYVDNVAWNDGSRELTVHRTDGAEWTVTIPDSDEDTYVTSATYNPITRLLTLFRNDAIQIQVSLAGSDEYISSATYNATTKELTLFRALGSPIIVGIPMADWDERVTKEIPGGSLNGINTVFTLANTPYANSETIYKNGLQLKDGGGNDYIISGDTITFASPPWVGDILQANYIKS